MSPRKAGAFSPLPYPNNYTSVCFEIKKIKVSSTAFTTKDPKPSRRESVLLLRQCNEGQICFLRLDDLLLQARSYTFQGVFVRKKGPSSTALESDSCPGCTASVCCASHSCSGEVLVAASLAGRFKVEAVHTNSFWHIFQTFWVFFFLDFT